MYLIYNRIEITSPDHLNTLKQRFKSAPQSMSQVPGFVSFRFLVAEDQSHVLVETVFETKDHYLAWLDSEHFQHAHGGQRAEKGEPHHGYHILLHS